MCLLVVIAIYCTIPGLWNNHNKIWVHYASVYFCAHLFVTSMKLFQGYLLDTPIACKLVGKTLFITSETCALLVFNRYIFSRYIDENFLLLGYMTYFCLVGTFAFMSAQALNLSSQLRYVISRYYLKPYS